MTPDGNYFLMSSMSSGEKQLLVTLSSIIYHLRNLEAHTKGSDGYENVNVIMEETELYFHPECQRNLIYKLIRLIENIKFNLVKRINILFVTHSPFVLSDIPINNVLFLDKGFPCNKEAKQTFSANISDMLRWNFFLDKGFMGRFASSKIEGYTALLQKNRDGKYCKANKEKVEKLYKQLKDTLGEPILQHQLKMSYWQYMDGINELDTSDIVKELHDILNGFEKK